MFFGPKKYILYFNIVIIFSKTYFSQCFMGRTGTAIQARFFCEPCFIFFFHKKEQKNAKILA